MVNFSCRVNYGVLKGMYYLISKLGQFSGDRLKLASLGKEGTAHLLAYLGLGLKVGVASHFALIFKLGKNILVLPANLVREAAQSGKATARLQAEDSEGSRHYHALHAVVWLGNTLKDLEAFHGRSTAGSLVREHSTERAHKDARRRTVMEGSVSRVAQGALAQKVVVLH